MTLTDFERRCVPPHLHDLAERARAALARFTTYPGTSLRIEFGGGGSAFVVASLEIEDADRPGRRVRVQKACRFELVVLKEGVEARLGGFARSALVSLFTHEVDEWLRVDGARFRRPHRERMHRLRLHLPERRA